MRVPSSRGIRGSRFSWVRGCLFVLAACALLGTRDAGAQAITRFARDTGNINFVTTGGSLRNAPNTTNACSVNTTSSQALAGIPANRTIRKAYLYWGASGNTADTTVTLNGNNVTASRTFTRTFNNGTAFNYFGGFADVTTLVAGNGNFTFGGLTVANGTPWCGSQAVVGGWALIVIYEGTGERLRAINLYDGLDYFYGSQVTQTPDGFRVPATNIDGRIAVFTLEGDPQNSNAQNGISESLRFNGTALNDGLIPADSDPTNQQFDGTINTAGAPANVQSYGIDVDQYDVSSLLSAGQTSATTIYSSGDDLVLLMAQIVSATSDPAVNLGVTLSHTGTFVAGQTGQYSIVVSNAAGVEREDNTVTVTDTLPTGFSFASASGTGWSCSAAGQVVTCTHAPTLNAGASFPTLTLTVNVTENAAASVTNSVTVSTPSFDSNAANNTATDVTAVAFPNLSTSTKTVLDVNGGDAAPGDTLRYTITLTESGGRAASGVTVTDHIPANATFASVVSIPAGATSSFSPAPNGDNDKGVLTVSGISVAANASVTVVFNVTVDNVSAGALIDNTATVSNPNGPDATPAAPTITVLANSVPGSGTKQLYLWSANQRLSRTRPTGTHAALSLDEGDTQTFVLNPALQTALTLNSGNFNVNLLLARTGSTTNTSRTVRATLSNSTLGTIGTTQLSLTSATSTMYSFVLNIAGVTAPVGSTFSLAVTNLSTGSGTRSVSLTPYTGTTYSRIELNSATVINVNSVQTWTQAWNSGAQQGTWNPGNTLYIRATVSDPFGSFDISGATVSIVDAGGTTLVANQAMTAQGAAAGCGLTTSATCVLQYQYNVPASPVYGSWTVRVTANEGVEGVTDVGVGSFVVSPLMPSLTMLKTSTVVSAPGGGSPPKRIPGAVVQYDIQVTNSGPGQVDANTLVIVDPVPANTTMYVGGAAPVVFVDGSPSSGLTFNYAANVSYSSAGEAGPFTYTPTPDANGFDAAVRAVRIAPGGAMNGNGGGNTSFTLQVRVRVN
jgi:trimeric autotransporter adhesin